MSIEVAGKFYNKDIYPGVSWVELFGSYPTWGDKYTIYDNFFAEANINEQVALAASKGGRLAIVSEIRAWIAENYIYFNN